MSPPRLLPLFILTAAPFIGSFIGVVIVRLPQGRPIAFSRSACEHCSHTLGFYDLIPVLSWALGRARCRHCGAHLSAFYPLVELAALAVAVWALPVTPGWVLPATVFLGWTLLALALIDWRTQTLPDVLTLPLAIAGLAVAYWLDRAAFADHALGAAGGFAAFVGIAFLYRTIRGREGLGFGDAKLMAALGAWISWPGLPSAVLYGGAAGLAFVLAASLAGRRVTMLDRLPFGTFLALGGWLVWLYGPLVPG